VNDTKRYAALSSIESVAKKHIASASGKTLSVKVFQSLMIMKASVDLVRERLLNLSYFGRRQKLGAA
jgi:hypothetical protein